MIEKILELIYKDQECFNILVRKLNIEEKSLKEFLDGYFSDYTIINIDGGSRGNPGESGIGIVINNSLKKKGYYFYTGFLTNNEAEYNALIKALELANNKNIEKIKINSDSELLVNQIRGSYKIKKENLIELYNRAQELIKKFKDVKINYIDRNKNRDADYLANLAMDLKKDGEIEFTVAE